MTIRQNKFTLRLKPLGILTLLTLALALTTACGGGWGEGGNPAEVVGSFAHEIEIYDIAAYSKADISEEQRQSFESTGLAFERFGINLSDANTFTKAIIACCDHSNTTLLQGARIYIVDGAIDLDAVRSALEAEQYEAGESSGYEVWRTGGFGEDFLFLNRVSVGFLEDAGYLVIGDTDGVREVLNKQSNSDDEDSAMQQVLSRIGDSWREAGLVSAQTYNTTNTHCAPNIRYNQFCQATAYYTSYAGSPFKTQIVTMYASDDQARRESANLEENIETTGVYEPIDVEIVDVKVEGQMVETTVEHESLLRRKVSSLF